MINNKIKSWEEEPLLWKKKRWLNESGSYRFNYPKGTFDQLTIVSEEKKGYTEPKDIGYSYLIESSA